MSGVNLYIQRGYATLDFFVFHGWIIFVLSVFILINFNAVIPIFIGFHAVFNTFLGFLSHSEHEPEKIKSRLHLAVEKAVKNADEFIAKKYPEESFFWALNGDYPDSVKKERQKLISEKLNFRGYYVDMIDYLDEPEGYRNFVKKLLADQNSVC